MARNLVKASNQYLDAASAPVTAPPLTLACWIRPVSALSIAHPMAIAITSGGWARIDTAVAGSVSAYQFNAATGQGGAAATGSGVIAVGTWAHVAATFSSSTRRDIYVDGTTTASDTTTVADQTWNKFTVGGGYFGASVDLTELFNGDIAEAAVYNVALTAEEVTALARGVSPLMIRPSALQAYYPLLNSAAPDLDRWRNRFDLTPSGSPTMATHPRMFYPSRLAFVPVSAAALAATPTIALTSAAALKTTARFAAAAALAITTAANLTAPGPLRAAPSVALTSTAALTAPVPLRAAASIAITSTAAFKHPLFATPAIAITSSATISASPRRTTAKIEVDGVVISEAGLAQRGRKNGLTIRDVLNDAPGTAALLIAGTLPEVGQSLVITMNDGAVRLFAGSLQAVDRTYEAGRSELGVWPVSAIDDTNRANRRRPFGTWVNVSATTVGAAIAAFAPSFATAIQAGLPAVSITLDGSETVIAAMVRLANLVGGYAKVEDGVISLFIEDLSAQPDPVDAAHPPLNEPPIKINIDTSQLRTRVYGKGYGETVPTDVAAGEDIIPIQDGAQFTATGGQAIAGTTAEGAQSQILDYDAVVLSEGGSLVGTGAQPDAPPGVVLADGSGIESGFHDWAYGFVTAGGRTKPSPIATLAVGLIDPPTDAPSAGTPSAGGLMDVGSHKYHPVFRAPSGRTTAGPVSNSVTASLIAAPTSMLYNAFPYGPGGGIVNLVPNAGYFFKYTFYRASDGAETTGSPAAAGTTDGSPTVLKIDLAGVSTPPAGFIRRWYRTSANNASDFKRCDDPAATFYGREQVGGGLNEFQDGSSDASRGANIPVVNTARIGTCAVTNIPVSDNPVVTHVDMYREFNNAGASTAKLAFSVTNGTTEASDTVANASLGTTVPASNTATANRADVSWPAGPADVIDIEIFRTAANLAQLKLLHTVGSNTAGSLTDSAADASLGTNAPTDDDSGLSQPAGQVLAGAEEFPVAAGTPFASTGGWVTLSGGQVVRYTGKSGNTLTGIPPSGPGAILTTVLYGQQAIPTPALVGVTGLTLPMLRGTSVHIWVQRNDLVAQAEHAAREGGGSDGIVEYVFTDDRRAEASLIERCDAELALFARPIVTATYATRDVKTKSGKRVTINLPTVPPINETLTIQEVTITEIDVAAHTPPRFAVTASSVRFSLEDILRRLVTTGSPSS